MYILVPEPKLHVGMKMNVLRISGDLHQVWYNRCHRSDGTISGDDGVISPRAGTQGQYTLRPMIQVKEIDYLSFPLEDSWLWRIVIIQNHVALSSTP